MKFVQFQKNTSAHRGIGMSPYEALFGNKAKVGLHGSQLPKELLKTLATEEDLISLLKETNELEFKKYRKLKIF